ncbi:neprilysin-1-like [Dermacentor variabilis]|uniref:neprilysin-1-like n=1 Tax=Dermacentor variabilis TaxID=34621 RepID=UPI003F5AEE12
MSHVLPEEEALCPVAAVEPRPRTSAFSEIVSAAIGSRLYLWTVAAVAGILVISSMMATSARLEGIGAVSQVPVHRRGAADAEVGLAGSSPTGAGRQRGHLVRWNRWKAPHAGSLVRSGTGRSRKGAVRLSAPSAEDRQLDAAGAETSEPEYIRHVEGCRSTVCRWQGEYLRGKLDETVDPCMDFYSYACSNRWFQQDTLAATPYTLYAAGQLMYRLENMFHEFHQAEASADTSSRNASFLARVTSFFLRCVSKERSRGPSPDVQDLFRHYGLEDYPYKASNNGSSWSPSLPNLTGVVGMLDRELGLAAIVRPSLTTARRRRQAKHVLLFLDPPESTPSLRLQDSMRKVDDDALLQKILAGFALLKTPSRSLHEEATQVLAVDKELSAIIQMGGSVSSSRHSQGASVTPGTFGAGPVRRDMLVSVSRLAKDYGTTVWSWEEYARILLGDVVFEKNSSNEPRVLVQVESPEQLGQLSALLGNTEVTALLNYVAFSLAAFLSPALPHDETAEGLLVLSHGEHIPQVPEELQACVHLLARTYHFGALSLARQAVSRDSGDGNGYKYEGAVRALVDGARDQVSALLRNRTARMTSVELWMALQRLDTLRVVFLAEPEQSDEHLSRYYEAALASVDTFRSLTQARDSGSSDSSGSPTTASSRSPDRPTFLQEYIAQQKETSDLYWNNPHRPEENLETRWPALRVKPRVDYFEARNALLVSPSLVSFLSAMLVGLDPLLVPVVGSDVVRALLSVVASSQRWGLDAASDPQDSAEEARSMPRHRENATRCLAELYANLTGYRQAGPRLPGELFFDAAAVEPLFELYRAYLAKYPELRDGPNIPELPGKNSLELFFINYAVAHCEHGARPGDGQTSSGGERTLSAAARFNVALMNSRAFAAVFHCKEDDVMNPRSKCEVW